MQNEINTHIRDDLTGELLSHGFEPEQVQKIIGIFDSLSCRYEITPKETGLTCPKETINYTVGRYFASLKLMNYADKTLYNKRKHLEAFFNVVPLNPNDIKTDDIRSFIFIYSDKRKIKSNSMNKVIETVRAFFRWCYSEGYIDKDPSANINHIKEQKNKPKKVLTSDELESIREVANKDPQNHALIELLYSSGARINEIANLKWEDCSQDMKNAVVLGKGGKFRKVQINTRAKRALNALKETQRADGSPYIFKPERTIQNGEYFPMTTNSLRRRVNAIKREAGVSGQVTPHTFRRTMATNLLNSCGDIVSVQKLLGHASIQTTTIYAQINESVIEANHNKFII